MSTIVVDGAKYQLWSPPDEEKDFRPLVEEHVNEIFGEPSFTFNLKRKIRMPSGKGGIPDSFVLSLGPSPTFWVVENELAKHPVYDHIMVQLGKFMDAMSEPGTKSELVERVYEAIRDDPVVEATLRKNAHPEDVYKFVTQLINHPRFAIVINDDYPDLQKACNRLSERPEIVYLRTYLRDLNNPTIHACLFNTLVEGGISKAEVSRRRVPTTVKLLQQEFWQGLVNYPGASSVGLELRKPRRQHWFNLPIGSSKAHISLTVNTRKNLTGCEIYISHEKRIFDFLSKRKSEIESKVGEKLEWMPLKHRKASRIVVTSKADISNKAQWPRHFEWFVATIKKFRDAFQEPIEEATTGLN